MIWRPDPPYTVIHTRHRLSCLAKFFTTGFLQEIGFVEDLFFLEVRDADGLESSVDVMPFQYGRFIWSGRYADVDLRVCSREGRQSVLEE